MKDNLSFIPGHAPREREQKRSPIWHQLRAVNAFPAFERDQAFRCASVSADAPDARSQAVQDRVVGTPTHAEWRRSSAEIEHPHWSAPGDGHLLQLPGLP